MGEQASSRGRDPSNKSCPLSIKLTGGEHHSDQVTPKHYSPELNDFVSFPALVVPASCRGRGCFLNSCISAILSEQGGSFLSVALGRSCNLVILMSQSFVKPGTFPGQRYMVHEHISKAVQCL